MVLRGAVFSIENQGFSLKQHTKGRADRIATQMHGKGGAKPEPGFCRPLSSQAGRRTLACGLQSSDALGREAASTPKIYRQKKIKDELDCTRAFCLRDWNRASRVAYDTEESYRHQIPCTSKRYPTFGR